MLNNNLSDLVSIIIPYHKKKNFIDSCVNSVLNQTFQNFEIIIIYDDPNLDDLNYIKNLKSKDSRIKLIINEKNFGAGISRNIGIKYGRGNFIAFIDADDCWKNDKLKIQIDFMKKNNSLISHTSYEIIDDKNIVQGYRKARDFNEINDLIKSCDIGLSTVVLSKNLFLDGLKFPNLKTKEDFVLWLKILKKGINISSIDECLTSWRKLDKSLSSSLPQKLLDAFRVYYFYMNFNLVKSCYYMICLSINFLKK